MKLEDIIKNTNDFAKIKEEILNGNMANSTLLFSKDNLYSFEFAKIVAGLILNDGELIKNDNYEKVSLNCHPDVKVYPTKDKLLVADSEEIVMESFVKPIYANKKIFIIKNIDNSMDSAQNKLLKILEEQPANVYFILTCASENLVLPTIKSRCNKIELNKLPDEEIAKQFYGANNSYLISKISDGLVGKGEKLSTMKNLEDIFNFVLSCITDLNSSKQVLQFSNKMQSLKIEFDLFLEILSLIIEDLLLLKTGSDKIRFTKEKEILKRVLDEYSVKALCEIEKLINKASKEVFYNTNVGVVIENLFINILEVKYICR